jgi:hypothetical protein
MVTHRVFVGNAQQFRGVACRSAPSLGSGPDISGYRAQHYELMRRTTDLHGSDKIQHVVNAEDASV